MCRVATGLSDAERHELSDRLRPNLVKHSSKNVPKMYHVTDNPKARPDVWVQDPQKSVILEVRHQHFVSCARATMCFLKGSKKVSTAWRHTSCVLAHVPFISIWH